MSETLEIATRSEPLDALIYSRIKQMILANQLRPGNKLVHQELAERLAVSRTPVRQALERLYQEGIVIRIPRRGYFVAEINSHEARDLYQVRQALEVFALRTTMALGLTKPDLEGLQERQRAYASSVQRYEVQERVAVDEDFHLYLASLSGNQVLIDMLRSVFERLSLKRRMDNYWPGRGPRGGAGVKEHEQLLKAIRRGDLIQAEHELRAHLHEAWTHFEAHLLKLKTG